MNSFSKSNQTTIPDEDRKERKKQKKNQNGTRDKRATTSATKKRSLDDNGEVQDLSVLNLIK